MSASRSELTGCGEWRPNEDARRRSGLSPVARSFNQAFTDELQLECFVTTSRKSLPYQAQTDFTARIAGIEALDGAMAPLRGCTLIASSGTVYPAPEPSSLLTLAAIGCGTLAAFRRRHPAKKAGGQSLRLNNNKQRGA